MCFVRPCVGGSLAVPLLKKYGSMRARSFSPDALRQGSPSFIPSRCQGCVYALRALAMPAEGGIAELPCGSNVGVVQGGACTLERMRLS